jgi:hypothetical protein
MTGVGFGPDNIYRTGGEESLAPGSSILSSIGDLDPLDILFEGDEEEEEEEDRDRNSNFGKKYNNGFGSEKFNNFNDFETRFDYNDRQENESALKNELSALIEDIGKQGEEETGSRRDRRARKFGDTNSVGAGEDDESRLISNMIREIGKNEDQYDSDIINSIQANSALYTSNDMDSIYDEKEVEEEEIEVEEDIYEEEVVHENKEEDLEEEYSLIGDD